MSFPCKIAQTKKLPVYSSSCFNLTWITGLFRLYMGVIMILTMLVGEKGYKMLGQVLKIR
jgi:hypothetical protein